MYFNKLCDDIDHTYTLLSYGSLKCLKAMVFMDRMYKWIGDPDGIIIQLVLGRVAHMGSKIA